MKNFHSLRITIFLATFPFFISLSVAASATADRLLEPSTLVVGPLPLLGPPTLLVARSIGKRTHADMLSQEGHAGLFGQDRNGDNWIAQAGPNAGYLVGNVRKCPSHGCFKEFSMARGAIWDRPKEILELPVVELGKVSLIRFGSNRLISIAEQLNQRRLRYIYETGPNSNTWVRMFLQRLIILNGLLPGAPFPIILRNPSRGTLALKGWDWDSRKSAPGK